MTTSYETDVVAWANEQARLIRAGQFDQLDLEHIAEEIEDVGKSEQRELASRMAVLLMHLLKWQFQSDRRSTSWTRTIREQRIRVLLALKDTPSLANDLHNSDWLAATWADAVVQAIKETGIGTFPETCPWSMADVLSENWLPTSN
jgi:Domain of unknown function DUF29